MFLSFLANLNIRPQRAQYLDTFYKMLVNFKNEDIHYVITEEYLKEYQGVWANCLIDYKNINFNKLDKTILRVPNTWGKPLKNQVINYNAKFNEKLCKDLLEIYDNTGDIHCIISWMNNATLKAFASATNLPLIHNELGALRPNLWKDSIYLDFQGVNHNTEFEKRLICFSKIVDKIELLSQEDLIKLVSKDGKALEIYNNKDCDKIGVALQVSTDSNLLMYANDWGIDDIVSYTYNKYGKENLLIKNHPFSMLQFQGDFEFAKTPIELLERSKKIVTINSSMGFEAMLLGKEAEFLGDNTFKLLTQLEGISKLAALNFAVLSYLVPANLLFNKDYYNFRINCNDEITLFTEGLRNWQAYDKI